MIEHGPGWLQPVIFIVAFWVGLWLLKAGATVGCRLAGRVLLPVEVRVLSWLQDRATARTLGIDIDVLRFRRKVDFPVTDRPE